MFDEKEMEKKLQIAVSVYQDLKTQWDRKPPNFQECAKLLDQLKIFLLDLGFLPIDNNSATKQQILLARDVLEIGAQWAIAVRDVAAFERYMAQLKPYYFDYQDFIPQSTYKLQLFGLNLLRLLAQNKLSDFHTELELLPAIALQNMYIKHPMSVEQYLMEGSYNKVFLARDNVPADSYRFFINMLLDTLRNETASCIEKAYERLEFNEAKEMLHCKTAQELKEFGEQRSWRLLPDGNKHYYIFQSDIKKVDDAIPAHELSQQIVDYARHLEMIV